MYFDSLLFQLFNILSGELPLLWATITHRTYEIHFDDDSSSPVNPLDFGCAFRLLSQIDDALPVVLFRFVCESVAAKGVIASKRASP